MFYWQMNDEYLSNLYTSNNSSFSIFTANAYQPIVQLFSIFISVKCEFVIFICQFLFISSSLKKKTREKKLLQISSLEVYTGFNSKWMISMNEFIFHTISNAKLLKKICVELIWMNNKFFNLIFRCQNFFLGKEI